MLFTIETTADHHQVPHVRMKRVPGTAKTETGTIPENRPTFAPGTETSLEPLKHTLFGEKEKTAMLLLEPSLGHSFGCWATKPITNPHDWVMAQNSLNGTFGFKKRPRLLSPGIKQGRF